MSRLKVSLGLVLVVTAVYTSFVSAQTLDRGALVLIKDNQSRLFVKVLAALPRDTVSILDGRLVVNGTQSDHGVSGTSNWGPRQLGESQYFVVGDPLMLNGDPAAWGIVEADSVLGTVQRRQ
jgi:type IV secretory pathway protease TraF